MFRVCCILLSRYDITFDEMITVHAVLEVCVATRSWISVAAPSGALAQRHGRQWWRRAAGAAACLRGWRLPEEPRLPGQRCQLHHLPPKVDK